MPDLTASTIAAVRKFLRSFVPLARFVPFAAPSTEPVHLQTPRRILLLHPGHIGDIVISTSILGMLEQNFPGAFIGFVAGSWSAGALDGVDGIHAIHILDHWRLNRSNSSVVAKWLRYWKTRSKALAAVRQQKYEVAISLLDVNPDLLDVPWAAKIPVRIGWEGSFFAPLATRLVQSDPWSLQHQAVRQAQTLRALGISPIESSKLQSRVGDDTVSSIREVCSVLNVDSLDHASFCIIHMGAGAPMKQMPVRFWRYLAEKLSAEHTLLFTGRGAEEQRMIPEVIHGLPNCINACNRLSWRGFVTTIRAAEMLFGVDSMAGHVAAAVGTAAAAAYQGAGGVSRWRPFHPKAVVFTNHLACAPCLLPNGCAEMPCKSIEPELLLAFTPPRREPGAGIPKYVQLSAQAG